MVGGRRTERQRRRRREERRRAGMHGSVVMCASLVDKLPNQAGLARTCEIFGAEQLVLPSLQFVPERAFASISATADQWVPMLAVPPGAELLEWLRRQKREGWALVGLEQTSGSHTLTDYVFPTKVVILLGTEREGIPPEYLQLLDACVEIPQQGIVRSLNVHVCGAIMLWEFTQQQLQLASAPSPSS